MLQDLVRKCIRPYLSFFLILAGADTGHAPEGAGEMRGVGIPQQVGNFRDGVFRVLQKIECCFITQLVGQVSVGQPLVSQPSLQCPCT